MSRITKAIIPAAGLGTRFLPYTAAVPKEMLPLLNKPAIHYIAHECMRSNLEQFIMVTNKDKTAIADYFDRASMLVSSDKDQKKDAALAELHKIIRSMIFTYIRQPEPLGLGHAVLSARHMINKEYFGVLLPDDLMFGSLPGIQQLMTIAQQEKATVIAVQEVPMDTVSSYGIIGIKKQISPTLFQVNRLVEKPKQLDAPSNLGIIGRYVISWKIFQALDEVSQSQDHGELQLTDGIAHMLHMNERVFAYKIQGQRYDIGTPLGWLRSIIALALQDPAYAPHVCALLHDYEHLGLTHGVSTIPQNML